MSHSSGAIPSCFTRISFAAASPSRPAATERLQGLPPEEFFNRLVHNSKFSVTLDLPQNRKRFPLGENIAFTFRSGKDGYLNLVELEPDGKVQVLFPNGYKEQNEGMFQLYEANRQQGIGNYIIVDFILTAYSLLVQELLTAIEEEVLYPTFRDLTATLVTTLQQHEPRPPEHSLALAYVAVMHVLLQPEATLPPEAPARDRRNWH